MVNYTRLDSFYEAVTIGGVLGFKTQLKYNLKSHPLEFRFQILLNRNRTTFVATRRVLWALTTPIMRLSRIPNLTWVYGASIPRPPTPS